MKKRRERRMVERGKRGNGSREEGREDRKTMTATEILYFIGEMMLLEIDERAEIEYSEGSDPHSYIFKMNNGRVLTVLVLDVLPVKNSRARSL